MNNKKLSMKLLSVMLALAMMVQLIPATVYASTITDTVAITDDVIGDNSVTEDVTGNTDSDTPVTILGEVESLRREDEKHFRMSDGSFLAVSYGIPVHYEDGDGGSFRFTCHKR